MKAEQVNQSLISRSHGLGERSRQGKPREHLHQIVMRRVKPQRQAFEVLHLGARVAVVAALYAARIDAGGRSGARNCVSHDDVQCAEGRNFAGLGHFAAGAGRADKRDSVTDGVDCFFQQAVRLGDPTGQWYGGKEDAAEPS